MVIYSETHVVLAQILWQVIPADSYSLTLQANSDRTPFIADLKPSGKYVMADVHKVRQCFRASSVCCLCTCPSTWLSYSSLQRCGQKCSAVQVGGIPAVMKYLLQKGYLDGSCLTVTGTRMPPLRNLLILCIHSGKQREGLAAGRVTMCARAR